MHPGAQQPPHLLQITPHPLRPHPNQLPRVPARRHDPLRPHPPHLIVRQERIRDLAVVRDFGEQRRQDERVFDGLAGALALVRRRGVRGVAHHCDPAVRVGRCGLVVPHGPDGRLVRCQKELRGV